MKKINKCGKYQRLCDDKIIHSFVEGDMDLPQKWKDPIFEIVNKFKERIGDQLHSIYIRGSLAQNDYFDGITDIDLIISCYPDPHHRLDDPRPDVWENIGTLIGDWKDDILDRYPHVSGVSARSFITTKINLTDLFYLSVHGRCVYGEDIIPTLEKCDTESAKYAYVQNMYDVVDMNLLERWIDDILHNFPKVRENIDKNIIDNCNPDYKKYKRKLHSFTTWSTKAFLRFFYFVSVMDSKMIYTRDLYPCYHFLVEEHPDVKDILSNILEIAVYGSDELDDVYNNFVKIKKYLYGK